jgi:predicted ATPase
LDQSYEALSPQQQLAFRRLAFFDGRFDRTAAAAILVDGQFPAHQLDPALDRLTSLFLLQAETDATGVSYHLLNLHRAYALSRLLDTTECEGIRLRHALSQRDLGLAERLSEVVV